MLFVVKEVVKSKQMLTIKIVTVCIYITKKFDFINALVKVVFIVFNNLHTNHLLRMNIVALDGLAECSRAQILNHLISTGNDAIDYYREVFRLLKPSFLSVEDDSQVVTVINYLVKLSWIKLII